MAHQRKIDRSLKERHSILHLLERLKKDGITVAEMEEIGAKLRKSGRRALPPLVRRLWREKNGELISKYTFLLDFFEDDGWVDQLIQIALKRRDLGEEGKAALLAVLQDYGVDVSAPPFSRLFEDSGKPLPERLPGLLARGEEGLVAFLEDFIDYPLEGQLAIVRNLPQIKEPGVLPLFDVLLGFDAQEVVRETVAALGKVRDSGAVRLLRDILANGDPALRAAAERSLRRLAFLGLECDAVAPSAPPLPFHAACATPIDGAGNRALWLSRWMEEGRMDALFLLVHEARGIGDACGYGALTEEECAKLFSEASAEEAFVPIEPAYALLLIRDALYRNHAHELPLPPEFHVRRGMFRGEDLAPAPYIPAFDGCDLERLADAQELVEASATLLDDEYLDGWFMAECRVYDFAEEWTALEERLAGRQCTMELDSLVERFCDELVSPRVQGLARRLFLTADLMEKSGRERKVLETALATALSLGQGELPCHRHPFIRRLVLESMEVAREALAEGFDLRLHPDEGDDWEWE